MNSSVQGRRKVSDQQKVRGAIAKMARSFVHAFGADQADWVLVGIQRRGVPLAKRLARTLKESGAAEPPVGSLDITFYRDDMHELTAHPVVHDTDLPFDISGKTIFLVDDVLYTGRTVRSALDQLMDFGRPKRVVLAVLVDRGHRELPVAADVTGEVLKTSPKDIVEVHLEELDGEDAVWVTSGRKATAREVS